MDGVKPVTYDKQVKLEAITFRNLEGNVIDLSKRTENLSIIPPSLSDFSPGLKATLYCAGKDTKGKEVILKLQETSAVSFETIKEHDLPISFLKNLQHNSVLKIILRIDSEGDTPYPLDATATHIHVHQTPEKSTKKITPEVNYRHWMNEATPNIAHLRLDELAWPGTHNCGVDMESTELWDEEWGACQDDHWEWQFEHGARAFDVRIKDVTEETAGVDEFYFYHGTITGERELRDFCFYFGYKMPAGEIAIIDIHEEIKDESGNFRRDLLFMLLQPLVKRMIPYSARNLTIAQIREQHPGKNLIIAGDISQSYPDSGFWPKITHKWIGQDIISEDELKDYIDEVMQDPPQQQIWSLSAAAYSWWTGPIRLTTDEECMKAPFVEGAKPSIVNVDFFTDVGVVGRCIDYNKKLGNSRKEN